ncbi:MAG TPA: hypothetical protein VGQ84_06230 [Gaiellaceae bacterium]|nr:hypothetical protein [Gaiellaceae bacterium]
MTASVAIVLAAAIAAYAVAIAPHLRGLVVLGAGAGLAFVVAAVIVAWDGGLAAGPALLLLAYALSLADSGTVLDRSAPLVAVALLAVVEFGSWSLEFRDGAEERPFARLPSIFALLVGGLVASTLVLTLGGVRIEAGLALWALGAAAAIGLLALISGPAISRRTR